MKRSFYKKEDKAVLQELTSSKVLFECLTRSINLHKYKSKKRIWTKSEYDFIVDNWGKLSKKEIAEKLNRSVQAVNVKANRIGLKNCFIYVREITLNELHQILFKRNLNTYTLGIWERYMMPIETKIPNSTAEYKTIHIPKFIEWLKDNKRVIDLNETDEGCFGIDEPEWLKEKRQADKRAAAYGPHNKVWTKEEDKTLADMVKANKYGYRDISVALKRTEGAIKRRLRDLKLKERPIKADNHILWTAEEINIVKDLWSKGYKSCIISEYINRSALAINGLLERYKYFGEPPLKYKMGG